jgi:isopenicillin N synthase-like dioxygenase
VSGVPVVDVGALVEGGRAAQIESVGREIDAACRDVGFFYVVGHGVAPALLKGVDHAARRFFALSEGEKAEIAMARAGRAWRGWFPLGGELTSGVPDAKEGLYFGAELTAEHPRVRNETPLHGANLFPDQIPELRGAVLAYLDAMTALGQRLLEGMALGLGLERSWFAQHLTAEPSATPRLRKVGRTGASPSTPTTGCSLCSRRTSWGAWRFRRRKDGNPRSRFPAASCATWATCSSD